MSCFAMYYISGSEKHEDRENDRDLIPATSKKKRLQRLNWQNVSKCPKGRSSEILMTFARPEFQYVRCLESAVVFRLWTVIVWTELSLHQRI